jgi:deoxyribose-phosphate aldolase
VIDNSLIKEGRWSVLDNELSGFRKACGEKILKVIVETSLINHNELEKERDAYKQRDRLYKNFHGIRGRRSYDRGCAFS